MVTSTPGVTPRSGCPGHRELRRCQPPGGDAVPPVVVCIGPVTAATARDAGLPVTTVADPHTVDGLLAALVAALA